MEELTKKEMKQKELYFHPLNYNDEAKLTKVIGSRQKLPFNCSLSWGLTVALLVERYRNFLGLSHPGKCGG